ncbi:ATP-binding protein [Cellvibrio sp. pealriver]|uniref:ATP-binding protein n=1 Tax=Cellvibrio sp. pealriver TaxID=1622269 RepID=UPI00066FDFF7|nr:ATP-binding protein [Cellvibrio sp. pealriver]
MLKLSRKYFYLYAKLPLLNLGFAVVYFLLVQFGISWGSLTSQVSLIWPAAGFALFSLLIFGLRITPGILLGTVSATYFVHLEPIAGASLSTLVAALVIGSAALFQAIVIARINRGLLSSNLLVNLRRTLLFIASVFLGTLIAASVGVVTLYWLSVIPAAEMGKTWEFWWMGDSIGMLVFTSAFAWLLIPRVRQNTHSQAFLLLNVGVGLVMYLVSALGYIEHNESNRFANTAEMLMPAQNTLPWYQPSWLQLSVLALGLSLIGLLTAYIRTRQKHEALLRENQKRLEDEVLSHTQALRKANDWLLNEVMQRQQTQEQLQESQAALRAREQHLRSLLDNIPDPVWFKNLDGIYVSCNKAFARMLNQTEDEVVGKTEEQLVSRELAEFFRHNDQQALKSTELHRYEQLISVNEHEHYLLDTLKVAVRDEQGNAVGILGIGRDISAQKEVEKQLSLAKDAAEKATHAKSRFLANMSHEIRTPLNAVLGYTQLLMRDEQFTGNQRERLQLILVASQRLLTLINDILDLSKIESGVLNLRKEYFDLHQEVDDIKIIMAERAQNKGLQLITQVDLPDPYIVKGDRQKIGQILLNLLGNAIKFTPEGSVSLYVAHLAGEVEFVIGDTGPGISEAELAELFSAFKQGQAGEDAGGTGLGLTLSRHLAEGMGGSLQLSSILGQGTLAHLRLPLLSENILLDPRDTQTQVHHLQPGSQCKVLVVEDDEASCEILVDLLQQIGCETYAAHDGREGLALCQAQHFDIIFTDIRMPYLNGLEMLRRLRALPGYSSTPIVAVSASSLEHERAYYLTQGFQEFIGKPYAFDDVFAALKHYVHVHFDTDANVSETEQEDAGPVDLSLLAGRLQELAEFAASGEMSASKKIITAFTAEQLGKQRHQQLINAMRQYDLEKIEQLVREWLVGISA